MTMWEMAEEISDGLLSPSEKERLAELFKKKYVPDFTVSIDKLDTEHLEELGGILNEISNKNLNKEVLSKMLEYGAPAELLDRDVAYPDLLNDSEFSYLKENFDKKYDEKKFSRRCQIAKSFYEKMYNLAMQDNDKSLYLRLVMMTKYHKFDKKQLSARIYKDPKRRLLFIKAYLQIHPDANLSTLGYCPLDRQDCWTVGVFDGIKPDNTTNRLIINSSIDALYGRTPASHIASALKDPEFPLSKIPELYKKVLELPYDHKKEIILKALDEMLPVWSEKLNGSQGIYNLAQSFALSERDVRYSDLPLTQNQINFYDRHTKEITFGERPVSLEYYIPEKYLDVASDENREFLIDKIKHLQLRWYYRNYFRKSGMLLNDATDFSIYISDPQKLKSVVEEGFFISNSEEKIRAYCRVCTSIFGASKNCNEEKNVKIIDCGLMLLQKLKREHPLSADDIKSMENNNKYPINDWRYKDDINRALLVLTYYGYLKDVPLNIENGDSKIEEKLLNDGVLKYPAKLWETSSSPISKYCDINEIWESEKGYKTNLLDVKLQRNAINDVIDLLNRGVNVSQKVERLNRGGQKFPITPFERYVGGIIYFRRDGAIRQFNENMQKIAEKINPNRASAVLKMFSTLSYKTRNDDIVKKVEKSVTQIITGKQAKLFDKSREF